MMRKRNIMYLFDTLFWYIVYMLPVIVLLLHVYRTGEVTSISSVLTSMNLDFFNNNAVIDFLMQLFGENGVMPLFASPDVLLFLTYFVTMILLHVVVDVVAFIPRLAHHWMDKYCKKEIE